MKKLRYYKSHIVSFMLPFNKFYFKELNADKVKCIFNESIKDSSKNLYVLVSIKDRKGVLKDLFVDGVYLSVDK